MTEGQTLGHASQPAPSALGLFPHQGVPMRTRLRSLGFALTVLVVGVLGCQRLSHEKTYSVDPGEIQAVSIDAPKAEQKVTVEVNASPGPVDVYVVLEDNLPAIKKKLLNYKKPD